jgi:hypothetical protein
MIKYESRKLIKMKKQSYFINSVRIDLVYYYALLKYVAGALIKTIYYSCKAITEDLKTI